MKKIVLYASVLLAMLDVRCIALANEDCEVQEDGTTICREVDEDGDIYLDDDEFNESNNNHFEEPENHGAFPARDATNDMDFGHVAFEELEFDDDYYFNEVLQEQ